MSRIVDYYFSMHSPWAYIGHVPFVEMARRLICRSRIGLYRFLRFFPRQVVSRSPRAIRPGCDIEFLSYSAGVRSGG